MAPAIAGESRHAIADYFLSNGALERACTGPRRPQLARSCQVTRRRCGDMCHQRAEPALITALCDPRPEVRLAAARSLGRLRSRAAVDPVLAAVVAGRGAARGRGSPRCWRSACPRSRRFAAWSGGDDPAGVEVGVDLLGQIGSSKDLPAVGGGAEPRRSLRCAQAPARASRPAGGSFGGRRITHMLRDDVARGAGRAAAGALAAVGDRSVATALIHVAQAEPAEVALSAAEAVSAVGSRPGGERRRGTRRPAPRCDTPRAGSRPAQRDHPLTMVGVVSVAYALGLNLSYALLWPLARIGITQRVRQRSGPGTRRRSPHP